MTRCGAIVIIVFLFFFSHTKLIYAQDTTRNSNRYQKYIQILEKKIKKTPKNPRLHTILGQLYQRSGKTQKAFFHYTKALSFVSGYSHALVGMAQIYMIRHQPKKAKEILDKVLQKHPKHAPATATLSEYYRLLAKKSSSSIKQQKLIKRAIKLLRQAILYAPQSHQYNFRLGLIYLALQKYSLARIQLLVAVSKRSFRPCYRLALYITEAFLTKTKNLYHKLLIERTKCHHPLLARMTERISIALAIKLTQKMKNKNKSIKFFTKTLQKFPNATKGYLFLSYLLVENNRCKEAKTILLKLLKIQPSNKIAKKLLSDKSLFNCVVSQKKQLNKLNRLKKFHIRTTNSKRHLRSNP